MKTTTTNKTTQQPTHKNNEPRSARLCRLFRSLRSLSKRGFVRASRCSVCPLLCAPCFLPLVRAPRLCRSLRSLRSLSPCDIVREHRTPGNCARLRTKKKGLLSETPLFLRRVSETDCLKTAIFLQHVVNGVDSADRHDDINGDILGIPSRWRYRSKARTDKLFVKR